MDERFIIDLITEGKAITTYQHELRMLYSRIYATEYTSKSDEILTRISEIMEDLKLEISFFKSQGIIILKNVGINARYVEALISVAQEKKECIYLQMISEYVKEIIQELTIDIPELKINIMNVIFKSI